MSDNYLRFHNECTSRTFQIILVFTLVPLVISLLIYFNSDKIFDFIIPFEEWFREYPIKGFVAFTTLYIIWVPLTLPSSMMTLAGGYIFSSFYGKVKGYCLCALAIWIGHPPSALLTFLLGRFWLKRFIQDNLI